MRKTLRTMALIMALAMVTSATACQQGSDSASGTPDPGESSAAGSENAGQEDSAEERVSLHFITRAMGNVQKDNKTEQMLEEIINADIDWDQKPSEGYNDAIAVIISSGDYPDMMEGWFTNAEKEITALYEEGTILGLNSLLEEYGSNILAARPYEENWLWMEDGERPGIPCRFVDVPETTFMIRQDWLDAVGMEMPTTLEELKEVARAFTFEDPDGNGEDDTIGFAGSPNTNNFQTSPFAIAVGAYGESFDWEKVGDQWEPWQIREGTKKAIEWYRGCYQEGLVEKDFMTMTRDQYLERKNLNRYGIEYWWITHLSDNSAWWKAYKEAQPQSVDAILPTVSSGSGETPIFPWKNTLESGKGSNLLIFKDCEHPDRVIQLIDYLATDEGADLAAFGPEGEAWELEGDKIVTKDLTEQESMELGVGNYNVVFWKNIYKRNSSDLVFDAVEKIPVQYRHPMTFPAYDGDTSALNSLCSSSIVSMIVDPNVDVDTAFEEFRNQYLSMGGQAYIDYMTENYNAQEEE